MEHRWGQRVTTSIPVRLVCHTHGSGYGRITDISLSGARIRTDLQLPRLALVNVIIEPSDAAESGWCHGPDSRLVACVVRSTPHELGLEWNSADHGEATDLLRSAVALRSALRAVSP
jgi:hypothetical protein